MAKKKRGVTIRGKQININRKALRQYLAIVQSMGGFARAGVLSPETRSKIARYAAEVRWKAERARKAAAAATDEPAKRKVITSLGVFEQPAIDATLGRTAQPLAPASDTAARDARLTLAREHTQRMLEEEMRRRMQ